MIDLGPHAVYIIAAYCGTALVTGLIIAMVLLDAGRQKKRLKELEALGVRRRSEQQKV